MKALDDEADAVGADVADHGHGVPARMDVHAVCVVLMIGCGLAVARRTERDHDVAAQRLAAPAAPSRRVRVTLWTTRPDLIEQVFE
ncbi:hypothetical protein TOK_4454 [Pseudonocardia sp. N23]|nr:hypothetical protein TOK_4454 [Pseudonocardia sp. N23]